VATHYETLGVREGADPDVVRRAYLDLARRLHPDRWIDASPDEKVATERRMREVNEAWRVLGNAGRRVAYDAGRRRPTSAPSRDGPFSTGDLFPDDAPADAVSRVLRALPWVLVLLALGAIFVFTAYATDDPAPTSCVRREGATAVSVPCDSPDARHVVVHVPDAARCPSGTEPFQPAGGADALCLRI
jgi:curved DNA-binding protein CbpA